MQKITMNLFLVVSFAVALWLPGLPLAHAATGNVAQQVDPKPPCPNGIGAGSAFDGTNLWYSCSANSTDLYRVRTDGVVTDSYRIDGGLGALVYDRERNGIWASWGGGAAGNGAVWFISLNVDKHIVKAALVGRVSEGLVCDLNDGLAYDARTSSLFFSHACSRTIHRYTIAPGSPPALGAHMHDIFPESHRYSLQWSDRREK
ncbi:hypothetical protein MELA_00566 [Candidatus Methylomirabilis lanthanidiphila]|uniref:Uncharacterized protein n=1 Tax=Candidatus Methylomirabilis lanthanidiphila TaxID=2211376 RepID=A0A564ZFV3_9BACT|nr:hypothetical protein [Candidatus Methylomirabilis lanthanidiphila]VUZ84200.1 hypothetical protein MELA_00566 [Candidatus Methylomirabilis lanthanidiphila]